MRAFVLGLLVRGGPSAVARFIIPVHFSAVQRSAFRSRTHVRIKCSEGVEPAFAYANTPASISRVIFSPWVGAALNHVPPRSILRARAPFCGVAMCSSILQSLRNQAATALG